MHPSRPLNSAAPSGWLSGFRPCGVRLGFGSFLLGALLVAAVLLQMMNLWTNHSSLTDQQHIHIWAAFGISSHRDPAYDSTMTQTIHTAAHTTDHSAPPMPPPSPLSTLTPASNAEAAGSIKQTGDTLTPTTATLPKTAADEPQSKTDPQAGTLRDGGSGGKAAHPTQKIKSTAGTDKTAGKDKVPEGVGSLSEAAHAGLLRGANDKKTGALLSGNQFQMPAMPGQGTWSEIQGADVNVSIPESYWNEELATLLEVDAPFYIPFDRTPYENVDKMPKRPLWWFGGFVSKTGYGEEARNYMLSMLQSGIGIPQLLWASQHGEYPHDITEFMEPWEQQQVTFMTSWRENNKMSPYVDKVVMPHSIVVCHSLPFYWNGDSPKPAWPPPKDIACPGGNPHAFTIGRTMTETHDITPPFAAQCNLMDEVWVPSEFHREQFARGGVHEHKLRVVPEGVNTTFLNPDIYDSMPLPRGEVIMGSAHPPTLPRSNITVFMSVFKFENRKGWDVLVESYLTEFNSSDPVELYLLTRKFGEHQPDIKWQVFWFFDKHVKHKLPNFKQYNDLPPIYLVSEYIPSKDLPRFYKAASVVVQPTRGEGWGRPQVEAMAMAIPVISTNWSGVTAFLDDTVGYPLPIDGIYPTWDSSASYFENQTWAGPSIGRLKKLMRYVMTHKEEREAKGRAARQRMVERFSPNMIARFVAAELERIHRKLPPIPTAVKVLCQDADRLEDVNCTTQNLYRPLTGANDSFWEDTYGHSTRQEFNGVGLTRIVWAVNASKPHPPGYHASNTTAAPPVTNPHTVAAPNKAQQQVTPKAAKATNTRPPMAGGGNVVAQGSKKSTTNDPAKISRKDLTKQGRAGEGTPT